MSLRCVKCNMKIDGVSGHFLAEESPQNLKIIREWIHPRELSSDDHLCHVCSDLSQSREQKIASISLSDFCTTCGKSNRIGKSRQILKTNTNKNDVNVVNVIADWMHPRQIQIQDRVCIQCWFKAKRIAEKPTQQNEIKIEPEIILGGSNDNHEPFDQFPLNVLITNCVSYNQVVKMEDTSEADNDGDSKTPNQSIQEQAENPDNKSQITLKGDAVNLNLPSSNGTQKHVETLFLPEPTINNEERIEIEIGLGNQDSDQSVEEPKNPQKIIEPQITLPKLKRGAATGRRCLFLGCNQQDKRHVPYTIRRWILADNNFYIPPKARMCQFHLKSRKFHELGAAKNAMATFTASHIEDMVSLLQKETELDLKQPENVDDHVFEYFLGYTRKQYAEIMNKVPTLNDEKIKLGFNALLCKMRTMDSNERISTLFRMPRRTLETYMDQALKILLDDKVPHTLRIKLTKLQEKMSSS